MGRIGGDSDLSDNGERFGEALARYIKEQNIPKVIIILSEDCFLIYWSNIYTFLVFNSAFHFKI